MRLARRASSFVLAAVCAVGFAFAQRAVDDDRCPYCKSDPVLMKAAGTVSHGPIAIGPSGSAELVKLLGGPHWIFIETEHLRWAFALGEAKVDLADRAKLDPLLDELRKVLPLVPRKPRALDPYLRLHLLALRGEQTYARFEELMHVRDADFPAARKLDGPFMGDGRFLGEKEKFEVVVHASRATHKTFTQSFSGQAVNDSFCWHVKPAHKLLISIPAEDADLKQDRWLFAHAAHNLAHAYLRAFKHFSYDPPIWLDEGLAWLIEKEVEPTSQTNDGEEGAMRDTKGPKDPWAEARRVAASAKCPTFAELLNAKNFGELKQEQDLIVWAMVKFLVDAHPSEFAAFVGAVKGQLDSKGVPSGANLIDLQRTQLDQLLHLSPVKFDEAFRAWMAAKR